ncbi:MULTISPECIES: DUF1854 domain-containing protein [unclassified Polynucleobacter]|uniref:cyanophycin metabolism-associated DUF1854 family protein n=1 Tax=unclassified Polynucleobacter TaxID=2640945 RepID=UPI0024921924|nr:MULTISPECIES: DUF1854 domain-containing protein [unclassified Polynucleobacter]
MNFNLEKDTFGNIRLVLGDGQSHDQVRIIRAFPISDPENGFSIVNQDGHELVWFESFDQLSAENQHIARSSLEQIEFIPVISKITDLNTYALPSIWDIETDRGITKLKLKTEQDIRRVSAEALLITDANGIQYLIKNRKTLDKFSKKVLDRFM